MPYYYIPELGTKQVPSEDVCFQNTFLKIQLLPHFISEKTTMQRLQFLPKNSQLVTICRNNNYVDQIIKLEFESSDFADF